MLKWGLRWYDFKDKSNTICTFYFRPIYVFKMRSKTRITMGMDVGELEEEKIKAWKSPSSFEIYNFKSEKIKINLKANNNQVQTPY